MRHVFRFSFKWGVIAGLWILALTLALVLPGWLVQPTEILDPDNVRAQWRFAYDYDEALQAIAKQVCQAEHAVADAESVEVREQRRSQLLAREANYARVKAEYDARLRDAFRAGWVKPPDVPRRAPALWEMKERVCR